MEHTENFLAGGGEMGALIRSMDWAATPLGPIEAWPQSLRTTVSLCLSSTFPILIAWGPETIQIYNDSYRPICGDLHPGSMGQNFRVCWESALSVVGDAFTRGQHGEGTYIKDQRMFLDRLGYLEEAWMTFSFAPIRDESGDVGGIFHPITETTAAMLFARRAQLQRDLLAAINKAQNVQEIVDAVVRQQPGFELDIPFQLIYQADYKQGLATLMAAAGLEDGHVLAAPQVSLTEDGAHNWPLLPALESGKQQAITDMPTRFGAYTAGPYPEAPHSALVLPIFISGKDKPWGFIVAGVSARRALDQEYDDFYALINNAYNTAFSNVYAYEQEQQRAEALAAIDRSKTTFFSNVSHEFRTPLTLMMGPLEELLQQPILQDPLLKQNLDSTYRNAQRLLKLVNNLLDFSRVEADRLKALFQPVDLALLTTDLASSFQSIIEKAGMQLQVDCQLDAPVYVDKEMWEKIVLNLMSNAFKYTLAGTISVHLYEADGHALLEVKDTGIGIPEAELPHMFERFHRVENSVGRTHEGSGIGLSLVSELVRLHGGSIGLQSVEGVGSVFTVQIPLGKEHLAADQISEQGKNIDTSFVKGAFLREASALLEKDIVAMEQAETPAANGEVLLSATILVVDDNVDMRNYLARLLEGDFRVLTARNGQEVLDMLEVEMPDLIISDIMMPVMDGKELLERLRANPATARLPLIFLSARAGNEARIDGLEAGADDYLVKPFSAKELLTKVVSHLKIVKVRSQAEEMLEQRVLERTRELHQAIGELTRTNKALEEFVYISSHDLQEPLRKIQTFGNMAMDALEDHMPMDQYVQKMIQSASRMSSLIKDLLQYSRLSNDQQVFAPVDLNELVAAVVNDFELAIIQQEAIVTIGELPRVSGMKVQLNQLFHNLLGNALKFARDTPVIHIGAKMVHGTDEETYLEPGKAYYEIAVADNGIGFEQQYAEQIFTIFQRLVKPSQYQGTGIGLTICRKVMEHHGGFIIPRSVPNEGTTFYLYFPV